MGQGVYRLGLTPIGQTGSVTAVLRYMGNGELASGRAALVAPEGSEEGDKGVLSVAQREGVDPLEAQPPFLLAPRAGPAIPWLS